ncbi:MAG TPA: cytochrome c [Terriglobia bacterium]|nr:cytochrome c [Terriglobia bacterium]
MRRRITLSACYHSRPMQQPNFLYRTAIILIFSALSVACTPAQSKTTTESEGKSLQNPIPATPESLASGKKLYERHCADCHGVRGDGVSEIAAAMSADAVRPPDLTDEKWDHGSTDGEIFVSIRDGVGGPVAMKGLNGRPGVGPTEMWHLVNYARTLKRAGQ